MAVSKVLSNPTARGDARRVCSFWTASLIAILVAGTGGVPTRGDDSEESIAAATKKLQGTWVIESVKTPKDTELEHYRGLRLTFSDKGYSLTGKTLAVEGTWKIVGV